MWQKGLGRGDEGCRDADGAAVNVHGPDFVWTCVFVTILTLLFITVYISYLQPLHGPSHVY